MKFEKIASFRGTNEQQTSRFILRSLKKGQGVTIANPLRRILLTEIEGSAISALRIYGMNNEYGQIPGVREDILEIILNLKQVRIQGLLKTPRFASISIKGPHLVTAGNINLPSELNLVNSNHYIASVSDNGYFKLEMKIESGKGYNFISSNQYKKKSDFFPIDAIFTPIVNVSYTMKDIPCYNDDELEDLDLLISTDGTIVPEDALICAAQYIKILFGSLRVGKPEKLDLPEVNIEEEALIEELQLSVRAYNCLKGANILTINDLRKFKVKDLKQIKNFGNKCANEVVDKLNKQFSIILD